MTCTIEGWLPEAIANGAHGHWAVKAKKLADARRHAFWHVTEARWKGIKTKARLEITYVFPNRRRRDTDNLFARSKGLVDGVKHLLVDDDTEHLELLVRAEVQHGRKATILTLTEIQ
jgi:Holliday junction resolvase RusA-like endonuclease